MAHDPPTSHNPVHRCFMGQKRKRNREGRNAACACGSGRKAKYCCGGRGQASLTQSSQQMVPLDWMAGFLEQHVRSRQTEMRAAFQRTYLEVFSEWAADLVHTRSAFDTERCRRFKELAEARLCTVAERYDRRFLLKALRTLPVHIVALVTVSVRYEEILPLLRDASLAVWIFSKPPPDGTVVSHGGKNAMQYTPWQLEYAAANLALDLGKLLGAAFARATAERAYRYAGKGGQLERPQLVPQEAFHLFEGYPSDGIIILDSPRFRENARLEQAVRDYDRRRAVESRVGGSGVPDFQFQDPKAQHFWWRLSLVGEPLKPVKVTVHYPALRLQHQTTCLLVAPMDVSSEMQRLRYFSDAMSVRLGFDWETFAALCRGLFDAVYFETGYDQLSLVGSTGSEIRFESRARPEADEPRSPGFLYQTLCGGTLRGPRRGFVNYLSRALQTAGCSSNQGVAERFIDRFSTHVGIDHHLTPSLFFPVDGDLIVLDFALMNEFFELCLRQVTAGDGVVGNQRAGVFEDFARSFLIEKLGLRESEMPIPPNMGLKEKGTDYGDVDFAFIRNGILFNLDMKSWQRTPEYFWGDYLPVLNRQKTLEALYAKVARRGEQLTKHLNAKAIQVNTTINLLCVAEVEFVSPDFEKLWYGTTPKVLTPHEIVQLVRRPASLHETVKIARFPR
jgi:hypothetical protein